MSGLTLQRTCYFGCQLSSCTLSLLLWSFSPPFFIKNRVNTNRRQAIGFVFLQVTLFAKASVVCNGTFCHIIPLLVKVLYVFAKRRMPTDALSPNIWLKKKSDPNFFSTFTHDTWSSSSTDHQSYSSCLWCWMWSIRSAGCSNAQFDAAWAYPELSRNNSVNMLLDTTKRKEHIHVATKIE
jgi:hypothetical protein